MQLTTSQQNAYEQILGFLINPAESEFFLLGPAGSGKTTLMANLPDILEEASKMAKLINAEESVPQTVVYTGMTSEAVVNLSEKMGNNDTEFLPPMTLHSYLGIRPAYGAEKRQARLDNNPHPSWVPLRRSPRFNSNTTFRILLVVDECSMMSNELLSYLRSMKALKFYVKVVFVGDPYQLPPVGEDICKPLQEAVHGTLEAPHVLLDTLVRQESASLQRACKALQKGVADGTINVPESDGDTIVVPDNLWKALQQECVKDMKDGSMAILSYTNDGVKWWSDLVAGARKAAGQSPYRLWRLYNNYKGYYKGTLFERDFDKDINNFRSVTLPLVEKLDENSVRAYEYLGREKLGQRYGLKTYMIRSACVRLLTEEPGNIYLTVVDDDQYFKDYEALTNKLADLGVENQSIRSHYPCRAADLRPADAMTVHKSQGKTFDTVFVDVPSILNSRLTQDEKTRMLYVACSRARKRLYLYTGDN